MLTQQSQGVSLDRLEGVLWILEILISEWSCKAKIGVLEVARADELVGSLKVLGNYLARDSAFAQARNRVVEKAR